MDKMKNKILHLLFILISQKYQNKNVDIPVINKIRQVLAMSQRFKIPRTDIANGAKKPW